MLPDLTLFDVCNVGVADWSPFFVAKLILSHVASFTGDVVGLRGVTSTRPFSILQENCFHRARV